MNERTKEYRDYIEQYLKDWYVRFHGEPQTKLFDAVEYSLLAGGKRLRPVFAFEFCRMCGADWKKAAPFAAAIEMIHTYSLIHDDLPCMDNDDLRRGKPTNHKVFGEDVATLAGDALLTMAFEVASDASLPPQTALAAVRLLSVNAGKAGMIGGQMIDLRGEEETLDFDTLLEMHAKKTGALIQSACLLGCYSAGIFSPDDPRSKAAVTYANCVGLAFQVIDDCLDAIGNTEVLGKCVGSDAASGKTTFLTFMTPDEAFRYAQDLTAKAIDAIKEFPDSQILCDTALYLLNRDK